MDNQESDKDGINCKDRKGTRQWKKEHEWSRDMVLEETETVKALRVSAEKQFRALIRLLLNVKELDFGPKACWAVRLSQHPAQLD